MMDSAWFLVAVSALLNAAGALLAKQALVAAGEAPVGGLRPFWTWTLRLVRTLHAWAGAALLVAAPVVYSFSLRRLEVSLAWPALVAGNLLLVEALAATVLHERVGTRRLTGCVVVVAGICLLAAPR